MIVPIKSLKPLLILKHLVTIVFSTFLFNSCVFNLISIAFLDKGISTAICPSVGSSL